MRDHRSTQQIGENYVITISDGVISSDGYLSIKSDTNQVAVAGDSLVLGANDGDITIDAASTIFFSGEIDTTSGDLTIKANNGSNDVNITSPVATGRSGQPGLTATGGSSNGKGIVGTGNGTGYGVHGVGITGYGVVAESDTTAPARSSLRIVPQDDEPNTSPAIGDIWVNTNSGLISNYYADGYWGRQVQKIRAITDPVTETLDADSSRVMVKHTIPANSLNVGTTIRVQCSGYANDAVGLPSPQVRLGGVAGTSLLQLSNSANNRFVIDSLFTIRSVSSNGKAFATTQNDVFNNTTYNRRFFLDLYEAVDMTANVDLDIYFGAGEGGAEITIESFVIDISD